MAEKPNFVGFMVDNMPWPADALHIAYFRRTQEQLTADQLYELIGASYIGPSPEWLAAEERALQEKDRAWQESWKHFLALCGTPAPPPYEDYIRSEEWREKAEQAKERAGYRCQVCNSPNNLHAHHRTYERLGYEAPGDITVLCADCHTLFHEHGRLKTTNE